VVAKSDWFLSAIVAAFNIASTGKTIRASFKDAGLVPHNPDTVLPEHLVEPSMPTDPAQAGTQLEPDNTGQRPPRIALTQPQYPQLQSHWYSRMTESQRHHMWECFRKITEVFESCNMSSDVLQAEMKETTESLRKLIRERSQRKGRPEPLEIVPSASRGRKVIKKRAKRHCRGCGRAGHDLRNCNG
jgi:hypothetical protein